MRRPYRPHRLRTYFFILIALWLPLQAAAAWTMPLCGHAKPETVSAVPCHEHAATVEAVPASPLPASDLDCDNCRICHLASTGFLLATGEPAVIAAATDVLVSPQVAALPSHIGDPPQQPPRRST